MPNAFISFILFSLCAFADEFTDVNNRNLSLDTKFNCLPENKIITKSQRILSEQCNMDKKIFSKYKSFIENLNSSNENYIEFKDESLEHPLLLIKQLKSHLSSNTADKKNINYKINSLESVLGNLKPWPVKYSNNFVKKFTLPESQKEIDDLYFSFKEQYLLNKLLNFRLLTDKFYSLSIHVQPFVKTQLLDSFKKTEEGDEILIKLKDYSSFSNDFFNEYNRKYSVYVESKNNFNRVAMKLVNDDFAPFKELEKLLLKKEELENENLEEFESEYTEINERISALKTVIDGIKMYRVKKFNHTQFSNAVKNLLKSGTALYQLHALMNFNLEQRNIYFEYKSQYWFEFFNYKYQLYREAIRLYRR